jgi:hexosaminidase
LKLLPYPRSLKRQSGTLELPVRAFLQLDPALSRDTVLLPVAERLQSAAAAAGVTLELTLVSVKSSPAVVQAFQSAGAPKYSGGHTLDIDARGVRIGYHDEEGLRAAVATLRQLLREYGRHLPRLTIRDYPDFPKRGLMLDVSRGRVPRLETLFELTSHLADFKINEFQLYTEHTFAYRNYEAVWRDWGPLTGEDILKLDAHCRKLGIELVPNQNSFGHLRYWLAYPPLKKLAETSAPWPDQGGAFLRHPATLAPNNPGTLPFLRELYDELLPNFTSQRFNVGCDETWDLGRGQSRALCEKKGTGRVYLDFLKKIHRETRVRKKQMLFWGDIILNYPELVKELPKDVVALNWGYEATHPFATQAAIFARSQIPFYVCPGTSTWMTLIGRHDTAFLNLQSAAVVGRQYGAAGYLNTDWGDGGHLQPLTVSYLPYLVGAAVSWCAASYDARLLLPVINRDVFEDPTGKTGEAALTLGFAHQKLKYNAPNVTPLGAVIAAPPPKQLELFCRDGLKYYARIAPKNVQAALSEIERQLSVLRRARPASSAAKTLGVELNLAARMAAHSCKFMLWQQSLAAGRLPAAKRQAKRGIAELRQLAKEFDAYWPTRNQGNHKKYWPCLQWRIADYRRGVLHFPPEVAGVERRSTSAD